MSTLVPQCQLTNSQKWAASLIAGIVFFIIASPLLYAGTTALFGNTGLYTSGSEGATLFGLVLHTVIFILIIRLILF